MHQLNKNQILMGLVFLGILLTGFLIISKSNPTILSTLKFNSGMSAEEVAQKSIDYINNNQLSQTPASLVPGSVSMSSGLVKFKITIGSNSLDSYATKDGKFLFPQALEINGSSVAATNNTAGSQATTTTPTQKVTPVTLAKTDNPNLVAYVVSKCPYGLQMQRAMSKAIDQAPELAKYLTIRYIGAVDGSSTGISAMHGDAEAQENLRQICIREEQPAKYWPYVSCHIKDGSATSCEKTAGVDSAKLSSCFSDKTRGVAYAKKDFELNAKYSISGSPTLILGDSSVSEFDFGGRSADAIKSIICTSSTNQPSFCSKPLDTTQAATSFSATYN